MAKGKAKAAKAAARFKRTKTDSKSEQEVPDDQLVSAADAAQHLNATQQAVVGLTNLGNTCFFNSSVQLLLACAPLQHMLQQKEHDITRGPLGFALQQAVLHASGRSSGGKSGSASTYNPQSLLSAVCCHAPVFKGKQQHDAHELMRVLLDGLQTQEQRYRELARKAAGKGSTALPNGTSGLANGHSSTQNGHPDLNTTSNSSSASSSGSQAASPQGKASGEELPNGTHAADSSAASSASSSDSSADNDTAAADGDGLADFCRAYLAKPTPATLSSLEDTADAEEVGQGSVEGEDGSSDTACSAASSTGAEGSASSSSSPEQQQHTGCKSDVTQGDQPSAMQGACSTADENDQQQQQQQQPDGGVEPVGPQQPTSTCSACGCTLQQRQQQQQLPSLQRKSLLPPEPPKSTGPSSVEAVFGGVLSSCITCTACGYCSISYEPFLDLSLPIPLGKGPEEGGLTRKGSLLSRLANRTTGKKKAAAQEPAADASSDAAAANAAAEAAATAAADAAAASSSDKKVNHKEKRRLQQAAAKAAKEAAKLARLAKKKQEQEDVSGSSSKGDGQQAAAAAAAEDTSLFEDPALFEDVPATNYYTAEQINLKQSVLGSTAGQQQQQQQGVGDDWGVHPVESQQQQDVQAQQQQQDAAEASSFAVSEASSVSGGSPHGGTRRVVNSDDAVSPASPWLGVNGEDGSPPTAAVSCWGGGWGDMRSPPAPSSTNSSSHPQPPPSSSSGFPPSMSDVSGHPVETSEASSSSARPTGSTGHRGTLHRRFGSLGSLTTLTSGAKGGLSNLFSGRHSRQGSRDKDSLDKLAAALAASSSSTGAGAGTQPSRPGSAGGGLTSPSTGRGGGLKGFLLNRSPTPPPPRPSSALGVVCEAAEGGGDSTTAATSSAAAANGTAATPELAVRSTSSSIPEEYAVDPAELQQQLQDGTQGVLSPSRVPENEGLSVCAGGPGMDQSTAAAAVTAAAGDSSTAGSQGQAGMQQQQQPLQLPAVRQLQRAFSDDAVVRLGSITRSSSGRSSSSNGGAGNTAGDKQQQQPAGVGTVTPLLDPTTGAVAAAAAAAADSSASTRAGGFENPFGAATVQQQQQPGDVLPPQQQQQQQEAPAGVSAPPAPGADPFAAAAVVSKGESLAVKHCLATFFLREEVCWECPKEKALWRERRLSAAGSAGSAAGRVSIDGRVSLDGRPRVSFEGSSSMGPKAAGNTGGSTGGSAGLCAACSSKQQQQEGEGGGGGVVIAAPHPRLQQLLEGAENEDGAIYKQVSFSDREPQVHLVPGSVEQRGTDLSAALAGRRPFCRALTWGGASLLLTAQLGEAFLEGAAAGRHLKLGLKAAGEGGVANAQAGRVLPGGQLHLGVVALPDVQGLGLSGDDSAVLVQHWAQLVLNCMADLVHCEGGITGLQSMVAGGLTLSTTHGSQPALRPGYVDASTLEGQWKVRGQLPPASAGGTSQQQQQQQQEERQQGQRKQQRRQQRDEQRKKQQEQQEEQEEQDQQQQEQQQHLGYWEYPAGEIAAEDLDVAAAAAADSHNCAAPAGAGDSSGLSNGVGVLGGSCSSSAGQSPASANTPAAAAAASSPGGPVSAAADRAGSPHPSPHTNGLATEAGAECGEGMFAMDDDVDEGGQGVGSEQQEQGPQGLSPQGWQGDALSSGSSGNLAGRALRSGSSWGSEDATTGDGSASTGRSVSLFRKVPLGPSGPAAAGTAVGTAAVQPGSGSADGEGVEGEVSAGSSSSSKAIDVPTEHDPGTAAAEAGASRPLDIAKPLQGSPPSDVSGAGVGPTGASPQMVGSAGSGRFLYGSPRRSSMRRRSSSSSRTAHKSYRIYLPPQVLLLHLKRFQHDGRGRLNKLDTAVKFEFELDLSPFLARNAPTGTGEAGAVQQGTGNGDAAVGSSEQQPQQQQQPQEQQQQQSLMYDLVGFVVHMGTMRGGHYIAYVKRVHGDATEQGPAASSSSSAGKAGGRMQWYYISDTTVRAVGVSEVAAAQAYMLLYARRPVEVAQQQGSQQLFEHDCGL